MHKYKKVGKYLAGASVVLFAALAPLLSDYVDVSFITQSLIK